MDDAVGVAQALALLLRQQIHFIHDVESRLVLRLQLAQHFLHLRLLLACGADW